jgi:hypothetical protein
MRQQFKVLSGKLKRPGQRLQEVALFDEAGDPLSIGSGPTDVLLLGTDVPLLNNWEIATLEDWSDYPARIYKQNGRAHMQGAIIKGAGTEALVAVLPDDYTPALFGELASDDPTWRWLVGGANSDGLLAQARINVDSDGIYFNVAFLASGAAPTEGNEYYLDSISWPLA